MSDPLAACNCMSVGPCNLWANVGGMMDITAPPSMSHFLRVVTSWMNNKLFLELDEEEGVAAFTSGAPLARFPAVEMLDVA